MKCFLSCPLLRGEAERWKHFPARLTEKHRSSDSLLLHAGATVSQTKWQIAWCHSMTSLHQPEGKLSILHKMIYTLFKGKKCMLVQPDRLIYCVSCKFPASRLGTFTLMLSVIVIGHHSLPLAEEFQWNPMKCCMSDVLITFYVVGVCSFSVYE